MRLPVLLCFLLSLSACAPSPQFSRDPEAARLVTDDLARFRTSWATASTMTDPAARAEVFQRGYFAPGSDGLQAFTRLRIGDADRLVAAIDRHPRYYASVVSRLEAVDAQLPAIRDSLRRMQALVPDAVFPDVYFLVGRMNSGGTLDARGLLVGVDMYGRGPDAPLDELGAWHRAVVGAFDDLPQTVVHEWVHFQQRRALRRQPSLLEAALGEGVADFITELGAGRHGNAHLHAWAEPRAGALWREFSAAMHGSDYSGWLYDGDQAGPERPADLGYWMGYRIARAYYARAADKRKAIGDMLRMDDAEAFLKASGVADDFAQPGARGLVDAAIVTLGTPPAEVVPGG